MRIDGEKQMSVKEQSVKWVKVHTYENSRVYVGSIEEKDLNDDLMCCS